MDGEPATDVGLRQRGGLEERGAGAPLYYIYYIYYINYVYIMDIIYYMHVYLIIYIIL